jgi:hypothetical protein
VFSYTYVNFIFLQAAGIEYRDDVYGTTVTINVWEPKVNKDSKYFSATWVQINNGAGEHTDRIGAGLIVNPSLSGDTFVRFHIAWVMHKLFLCVLFY